MGRGMGAYAEFIAVNTAGLMRIPGELPWAEAAAIPNVFVTAHDAIATAARLQPGETVLVTAASSGVGTAAMQLARFLGASKVFATTRSSAKADRLSTLGADEVFLVGTNGWVERVNELTDANGVDVIIDSVGGPMLAENMQALAIQGRLISVGRNGGGRGECDMEQLAFKRARLIGVTFRTRSPQEAFLCGERFAHDCLHGFANGELHAVVDRTFPFGQLAEAHRYMFADSQLGKIVLTLS
jgi:NADPH:quinone reductase-like Zn-dependent oxidoreductase